MQLFSKKERESGIELFRIIAAIAVVMLHYKSKITAISDSYLWIIVESLCIWAVNGFLIISGFFLSRTTKRTWGSILKLIFQYEAIHIVIYCAQLVFGKNTFTFSNFAHTILITNYYVVLYTVLYIISPFINVLINSLKQKQQKVLAVVIMIVFCIYPTLVDLLEEIVGKELMGIDSIGAWGSQQGFNILHFCCMYCIGAILQNNAIATLNNQKRNILILVFSSTVVVLWAFLVKNLSLHGLRSAWVYHNPFVVIQAVSAFMLFKNMHLKNRMINCLAPATLTCFLFHNQIISRIPFGFFSSWPSYALLALGIILCIVSLLVSWFIFVLLDYLYRVILAKNGKKEIYKEDSINVNKL